MQGGNYVILLNPQGSEGVLRPKNTKIYYVQIVRLLIFEDKILPGFFSGYHRKDGERDNDEQHSLT